MGFFPEALEGAPAPLSGGQEDQPITKEEIAPEVVMPELPAILDATAADVLPKEEPILDQDWEEQSVPAVSRKREADEMYDEDEEPDFGGGIGDLAEEIVPQQYESAPHQPTATVLALPPAPQRGGQYRSCPHCGARHIVAKCFVCHVGPRSSRSRRKSSVRRSRPPDGSQPRLLPRRPANHGAK